jgi:hypothetical protein
MKMKKNSRLLPEDSINKAEIFYNTSGLNQLDEKNKIKTTTTNTTYDNSYNSGKEIKKIKIEHDLKCEEACYIMESSEELSTNSEFTLVRTKPCIIHENHGEDFIDINLIDTDKFNSCEEDEEFDINKIKEEVGNGNSQFKNPKKKMVLNSEGINFILQKFPQFSKFSHDEIKKISIKTVNKLSFIIQSDKVTENPNNKINLLNSGHLFTSNFLIVTLCISENLLKPSEDLINILLTSYRDDSRCISYSSKTEKLIIKSGGILSQHKTISQIYQEIVNYFSEKNYQIELTLSTYLHFEDTYSEIKNLNPHNFRHKFPKNYTIDINKRVKTIKKLRKIIYDY